MRWPAPCAILASAKAAWAPRAAPDEGVRRPRTGMREHLRAEDRRLKGTRLANEIGRAALAVTKLFACVCHRTGLGRHDSLESAPWWSYRLAAVGVATRAAAAAALGGRALAQTVAAAVLPVLGRLAGAGLVLAFHGRFLPENDAGASGMPRHAFLRPLPARRHTTSHRLTPPRPAPNPAAKARTWNSGSPPMSKRFATRSVASRRQPPRAVLHRRHGRRLWLGRALARIHACARRAPGGCRWASHANSAARRRPLVYRLILLEELAAAGAPFGHSPAATRRPTRSSRTARSDSGRRSCRASRAATPRSGRASATPARDRASCRSPPRRGATATTGSSTVTRSGRVTPG